MKAILEFEAPRSCYECQLSHLRDQDKDKWLKCLPTRNEVTGNEDRRAPDCPLKIVEEDKQEPVYIGVDKACYTCKHLSANEEDYCDKRDIHIYVEIDSCDKWKPIEEVEKEK